MQVQITKVFDHIYVEYGIKIHQLSQALEHHGITDHEDFVQLKG